MNMTRSMPRGRFLVKDRAKTSPPTSTSTCFGKRDAVEDGVSERGVDVVLLLDGELGGEDFSAADVGGFELDRSSSVRQYQNAMDSPGQIGHLPGSAKRRKVALPRTATRYSSEHYQRSGRPPSWVAREQQPRYQDHRTRLLHRFVRSGLRGFVEYEVVEMLLILAIPRGDVGEPTQALLDRFGSLRGVLDAPLSQLRCVDGVGEHAAMLLKVIRDAAELYLLKSSEQREALHEPGSLTDFWRMYIGNLKHEVFGVAYLDAACRLLPNGVEILQRGTVDRTAVYPRRVVEAALRHEAAGLVLAHNHPNGSVRPTEYDKLITRAIVLAAETIGLRVVDHLVVSSDETFSFRRAGLL